ncbi:MAG TPA: hypothetical protein VGX00_04700 [Thermoplasmata archaeon]|nr:hypothetical protein [Thermoplasmata archaeon]
MAQLLPMLRTSSGSPPRRDDLARGRIGWILWGAPVGLLILATAFASAFAGIRTEGGVLLVVATGWLGLTCLANARRCGRTHCWIDGIVLPAFSVAGLLILLGRWSLPWTEFASISWAIVLVSFGVECWIGPYLPPRRSPPLG